MKPLYNATLGAADTSYVFSPPYTFPGVTARVFPLRASMNILRSFCRNYLNVSPDVRFSPALPCVQLVVLDYGRMSVEKQNLGWVSQHEVFFAVPLGMWRRTRQGRWQFVKWVLNTPFIVVDDERSLTGGRETYGWPKILGRVQQSPESWLIDPRSPIRFLTLALRGLSDEVPDVPLLAIEQQLNQDPSLVPPDLGLIDPFEWLSRLTRNFWSGGFDLAQLLLGAPLAGFGPDVSRGRRDALSDSVRRLAEFYQRPGLNVVTLKQFPDAGDPTQICYQSIIESRLGVARVNRGGLLGLYNYLLADTSGGFRILLHESSAFQVVETLGLEVTQERRGEEGSVAVLEPIAPFWLSVDLSYDKGKTICWRMRGTPWHHGSARIGRRPSPRAKAPYNTFAGGAEQIWHAPYFVPQARTYFFPLRADRGKLHELVRRYLFVQGSGVTLRPIGQHVYMVISSNRTFSLARGGGWIESRQIAFLVPLIFQAPGAKAELVITIPFMFVDNPILAMSMREVEGSSAMAATIQTPARLWHPEDPMFRMQLDVFTVLGAGLRSEKRTLLEVVGGDPVDGAPTPGSEEPLTLKQLNIKQFRDVEDPDRACYQALVLQPWTYSGAMLTQPLSSETRIRIYRYPSLPLVDILALSVSGVEIPTEMDEALADVLAPEAPFWMESDMELGLAEVFSQRGEGLPWQGSGTGGGKRCKGMELDDFLQLGNLSYEDVERDGLQPLFQMLLNVEGAP